MTTLCSILLGKDSLVSFTVTTTGCELMQLSALLRRGETRRHRPVFVTFHPSHAAVKMVGKGNIPCAGGCKQYAYVVHSR